MKDGQEPTRNAEQDAIVMAVYNFCGLMEEKMLIKYVQGLRGWCDPQYQAICLQKLYDNIKRGDFVDVANLAMILHGFKKEKLNEPTSEPKKGKELVEKYVKDYYGLTKTTDTNTNKV